jgi:ribosomal protein L7/L12
MATPKEELPQNVQEALRAGHAIEAIKLLREATGLGLKEAKDRLDAHDDFAPQEPQFPGVLPAHVLQALQAGNKIEAIRLYRQHAGVGLKEAKEAVEAAQPRNTQYSPGEVPRRSGLPWVVVLLVAVAALYYFFRR